MNQTSTLLNDRQAIINLLKEEIVEVMFTKANGDERYMMCTLIPEYLPETESTDSKRKVSEETVVVWDLEISGWRSFRVDSLTSISVYEPQD